MNSYAGNVGLPPQQSTQIGPTVGAAQTGIGALDTYANMAQSFAPAAQATAMNMYNNPYAGQALSGATQAAPYGMAAGQAQFGAGATMLPYAQSLLQMGADPQQALYNRTLQQTTDQQNAQMAQAGVGTTPYGQGLQAQNLQNFNMDWNNQQLARTLAANQGAGQTYQTALGFMGQAPQTMAQSAAIPYATAQNIGQGQLAALQGGLGVGTGAANLSNLPVTDYLSLLSGQNQANQVANTQAQTALNQSQLGWNQMAGLGSSLGSGLGWLSGGGPAGLAGNLQGLGMWAGLV